MDKLVVKLSDEQLDIKSARGNLTVQAFAGTGKTTTAIAIAEERHRERGLYLCFNSSNRERMDTLCQTAGITNIDVHTVHKLAHKGYYRHLGKRVNGISFGQMSNYTVQQMYFKEIDDIDGMMTSVISYHINRCVREFCYTTVDKLAEFDYQSTISKEETRNSIAPFMSLIKDKAKELMTSMIELRCVVSHDFYLKMYTKSAKSLDYDFVIFDEIQDASPVMLELFLKQDADKIAIGDTHQQIYGWRRAQGVMDKLAWPTKHLTGSFRFGDNIAGIVNDILEWKSILFGEQLPFKLKGLGPTESSTQAALARSNSKLLAAAVEFIEQHKVSPVAFEGGLEKYTMNELGVKIEDVFHLYYDYTSEISNRIKAMFPSFESLKEYATLTEDATLLNFIDFVKAYNRDTLRVVNVVRENTVTKGDPERPEIVFSTTHKTKGMEFSSVYLENDFMGLSTLRSLLKKEQHTADIVARVREEINVLYVAATRACHEIQIPKVLLDEINNSILPIKFG